MCDEEATERVTVIVRCHRCSGRGTECHTGVENRTGVDFGGTIDLDDIEGLAQRFDEYELMVLRHVLGDQHFFCPTCRQLLTILPDRDEARAKLARKLFKGF